MTETPEPHRDDLEALLGREAEVEVWWGEQRIPLSDLTAVEVGDPLLLLPRDRSVELFAAGIPLGTGTVVEVGGRRAVRIDALRPRRSIAAELGGVLSRAPATRPDDEPRPRRGAGDRSFP